MCCLPYLEPEQAWVPWLDWRGFETGILNFEPSLKPVLSVIFPSLDNGPWCIERMVAWASDHRNFWKVIWPPGPLVLGSLAEASFLRVQPHRPFSRQQSPRLGCVWKGGVKPYREEVVRHKALSVGSSKFHSNSQPRKPAFPKAQFA